MINIAFIDDDRNILDGILTLLEYESAEWNLFSYTDPLEARRYILSGNFDIVVTDVSMPGLNGLELLYQTKAFLKDEAPEFIIITGMEDHDLKKAALDLDATDLMTKPVSKDELIARIHNAIRFIQKNEKIKKQNEELENQLYQARKMELVGMMTAGLAHDFNNIMAVIVSYTQLLESTWKHNKNIAETTNKIQKISDHGIKMLRQILDFVKGNKRIVENICLNNFIQDSINLIRASITKKINIDYKIANENIYVTIESTQLFQILMNLVLNAAHAIGQRKGNITIILKTLETEDGAYALLKLVDDGPGMDTDFRINLLKNIKAVKKSKDGTGLGLSIVQRLVNINNGMLSIESTKGVGSEFTVLLPRTKEKLITEPYNHVMLHSEK
jgi:signal transduction histidine kinase